MTHTNSESEFIDYLESPDGGALTKVKIIDDGDRYVGIKPLLFHRTMIVGVVGDYNTYEDRWCYANKELASKFFDLWDGRGEPDGWHRHPKTGRRRDLGDQENEYISL